MKSSLLRLVICLAVALSAVSCSSVRQGVDCFNELGFIPSEKPPWRPAYGWRNADYVLCTPEKPAPATWCRAEYR
jgi:hypothetical protein